jgi:ACR3 family arsenite efflux pump ArsB
LICGFAISVVPGWHAEIAPPFMIFSILLLSWLYLLSFGYFMLERKNRQPPQRMVIIHLLLTLLFFFYSNGANSIYNTPNGFLRFIVPLVLFAVGQLIFMIVFVRRISRSPK